MKITIWSIFRDFVNSKLIGSEITRQEIISEISKHLVSEGRTREDYKLGTVANFSMNTVDCNRIMSEWRGFLSKKRFLNSGVYIPGVYIVEKHFPLDYTSYELRRIYYKGLQKIYEGFRSKNY